MDLILRPNGANGHLVGNYLRLDHGRQSAHLAGGRAAGDLLSRLANTAASRAIELAGSGWHFGQPAKKDATQSIASLSLEARF